MFVKCLEGCANGNSFYRCAWSGLSFENRAQLPLRRERESCLSIEIWLERQGNAFRHGEVQCRRGFVDRPGYIDLVGHISRHVTCWAGLGSGSQPWQPTYCIVARSVIPSPWLIVVAKRNFTKWCNELAFAHVCGGDSSITGLAV
jgi:hypothetical protein